MIIKYRPEIDGMRAVAVLAVVIYHAQFFVADRLVLKGGYLGVDIFFVISGYLICSIIIRGLRDNTFSLADFYERRARRILPVLFTVIAVSTPYAWTFLLSDSFKAYAGSVLSSLIFGSNIWFWMADPYFAEASLQQPFLHTWSLAVEEQFYIIFPVLILALWAFSSRKHLTSLFIIALLLSLQLADTSSTRSAQTAFYMLPTRGWELLAGCLLAKLEVDYGRISHPILDIAMPPIGLFLITYSLLLFDSSMPHPSYFTVVPVLGSMLLIWFARPGELVSSVLASRPFVGIGLISYGFYLWHFPVFAFARIQQIALNNIDKVGLAALAAALATLTFFVIERPARNRSRIRRKVFVPITLLAFCLLAAVQTHIYLNNGLPERGGSTEALFKGLSRDAFVDIVPAGYAYSSDRPNELINPNAKGWLIAAGDSHADMLRNALVRLAERQTLSFVEAATPGCPQVLDTFKFVDDRPSDVFYHSTPNRTCNKNIQRQRVEKIGEFDPSVVVYSARLPLLISGRNFDNGEGGIIETRTHLLTTGPIPKPDPDGMKQRITQTIRTFLDQGHKVVLVYPVPEVGWDVPKKLNALLHQFPVSERQEALSKLKLDTSLEAFRERAKDTYDAYDAVGEHANLLRIFPAKFLCSETTGRCRTHNGEFIFYRDDNHLSKPAAELLIKEIEAQLQARGFIN
jgi:peptidoglycan/LPS O-acetylase OafA/YrhL